MADQFPQWKQKGHTGGFSDDRFIGIRDSFAYAKGVEIRKNPHTLRLAYAVDKDSGSVVVDLINCFITVKSSGDILGFGSAGNIYRKVAGAGSWIKVYTQASTPAILNAIEYNGYVYWATATNLHRLAVSAIDSDWSTGTTPTIDYKAFTNGSTIAHPMLELNNQLYIGDGYYLGELSSAGVYSGNKLTIFNDEYIRAITFGGSMMRIFSRKSDKVEGGHKYFWDGTALAYNERVFFRQSVHCAISNGGDDFVIAGKRPYIYNATGYQWQKLKKLYGVADSQSCYLSPNSIDYFDDLLVIAPAESGTNSMGRGVWTWGQEDYKYPNSLNFDYPSSNDNTTDIIGCVHNSNGVLYFSWKKPGTPDTFGIDVINTAKYRTTGEIHSIVHYGQEADEEKGSMGIKFGFVPLAAGQKIEVFLKKDLGSFSGTAAISADYAHTPDSGDTYPDRNVLSKREDVAMEVADYTCLETKTVLTAGTSGLTTPELMELSVLFDPDIETAQ